MHGGSLPGAAERSLATDMAEFLPDGCLGADFPFRLVFWARQESKEPERCPAKVQPRAAPAESDTSRRLENLMLRLLLSHPGPDRGGYPARDGRARIAGRSDAVVSLEQHAVGAGTQPRPRPTGPSRPAWPPTTAPDGKPNNRSWYTFLPVDEVRGTSDQRFHFGPWPLRLFSQSLAMAATAAVPIEFCCWNQKPALGSRPACRCFS